uniref:CUB domain-containing protein n=1 Tax=Sinocyclocheilus anshuiensis TaxID=1608454 RepID=A0A671NKD0_9TELE
MVDSRQITLQRRLQVREKNFSICFLFVCAISSPGYPNNYPSPSRCTWLLEAPVGHTIILTFTYFEMEEHSQCTWDSVTVFNGASPGSPVIGQYCGHNSPGTIQSGSNKLVVLFLADHTVSRGGFTATWSTDSSGIKKKDISLSTFSPAAVIAPRNIITASFQSSDHLAKASLLHSTLVCIIRVYDRFSSPDK